ncbi:MAG: hypothetical protein K8L99_13915 [Anaerolineae bacterium]|nr:hypothetical protein [Anaerolineae bacterium]
MMDFAPPASIQNEVMAFLLSSPTPQQIIEFRASDTAQQRLRYLLDANRNETLTPEEEAELDEASNINQFMMTLKAEAYKALE